MACNCEQCGGKVTGLAHIGIMTPDIEASVRFYSEILGFTVTKREQLGETHLAFLDLGNCPLELIQPGDTAPLQQRPRGIVDHIALEVEDIEPLVCKLIEKHVPFESGEIGEAPLLGGIRNIFFAGPSGERVEFFEYLNKK